MVEQVRPADLTAFLGALALSADHEGGVDVDEIGLVESAWEILDTVVSSYGWVLALKDGYRFYLECTLDGSRRGAPEDIEITPLDPETIYPGLEDHAGVFWYRPDHINRYLGITGPFLH